MKAEFSGGAAVFEKVEFRGETTDFSRIIATSFVVDGAEFTSVPDFRHAVFENTPYLSDIKVKDLGKKQDDNAQKYRKLKELAIAAHDRQKELEFHGYELKAMRGVETTGFPLFLNYLYGGFSNFGQSVFRPFWILLIAWTIGFVSVLSYHGTLSEDPAIKQLWSDNREEVLLNAAKFSALTSIPFISLTRKERTRLYGSTFTNKERGVPPFWARLTITFQQILSIISLFLIGLALRNRFKIG